MPSPSVSVDSGLRSVTGLYDVGITIVVHFIKVTQVVAIGIDEQRVCADGSLKRIAETIVIVIRSQASPAPSLSVSSWSGIGSGNTVVTGIPDLIAVTVCLAGVGNQRTVIGALQDGEGIRGGAITADKGGIEAVAVDIQHQ